MSGKALIAIVAAVLLVVGGGVAVFAALNNTEEDGVRNVGPGQQVQGHPRLATDYRPPARTTPQGVEQEKMAPAQLLKASIEAPATPREQPIGVAANNSPRARDYPGLLRPCRKARGFTVFGGERLAGQPLRRSFALCQRPPRVEDGRLAPPTRQNFVQLSYGKCFSADEGGCSYDLVVYNRPSCEEPHNLFHVLAGPPDAGPEPHKHTTLRGVPAAIFNGGRGIQLYTNYTTIAINAPSRKVAMRVVRELRPVKGSFDAEHAGGKNFPRPTTAVGTSRATRVACAL